MVTGRRRERTSRPSRDERLVGDGIADLVTEHNRIVAELHPLVGTVRAIGFAVGTQAGADLVLALRAILDRRAEGRPATEAALAWADFVAVGYADRGALAAGAAAELGRVR